MSRGEFSASIPTSLAIGVPGQKYPTPVFHIFLSVPTMVVTTSSWLTAPSSARRTAGLLNGACRWFMRRIAICPEGSCTTTFTPRLFSSNGIRSAVA